MKPKTYIAIIDASQGCVRMVDADCGLDKVHEYIIGTLGMSMSDIEFIACDRPIPIIKK